MRDSLSAEFQAYTLNFKRPSGTSRGVLTQKPSFFLTLISERAKGIGECGILPGLSVESFQDYPQKLAEVAKHIHSVESAEKLLQKLTPFPSIRFGLEMALLDLKTANPFELFPSAFSQGEATQAINGLVWMGDLSFMKDQLRLRLEEGFRCIKIKIGALDFEEELRLLQKIRKEFPVRDIELRVDANGAFDPHLALDKLKRLAKYDIHSIEQPIRQGQWQEMARLCEESPIPIALDEELIGVWEKEEKARLLSTISPQYLIYKPSLIGGIAACEEWIGLAKNQNVGWWVTSALESNIGLNAIAQWTYTLKNSMPQGLGTGSLYTNNFPSPLYIAKGRLGYNPKHPWELDKLLVKGER
ncbi:MAG: o-succinylbenzoate synthase [Bacteroidota bacterium]